MLEAEKIKPNWEQFRLIIDTSFPTRKDALNRLYDDFKIEEIKEMNANMLKMFQDARNLHPDDPELLVIKIIKKILKNSSFIFFVFY